MGSFQYNGAISGSILNTPLGDARFYEHNGQITLASDGGQGVVTLTAAAKQTSSSDSGEGARRGGQSSQMSPTEKPAGV